MLEVQDLTVIYRDHHKPVVGVDGLSVSLRNPGIAFMVGKNGCGKSSILKALGSRVSYTGRVSWRGKDLALSNQDRVRWFPQFIERASPDNRTVEELFRAIGVQESSEVRSLLSSVFGGEEYHDRLLNQLSGGQRQILIWLVAAEIGGDLFLLDETFQPIDLATREIIWSDLVTRVSQRSGLALIVSHDLYFVVSKACPVIVISSKSNAEVFEAGQLSVDDLKDMLTH